MSALVAFLEGTGRDGRGRRLAEIIVSDDRWLEAKHDYIQWLFPLPEPSHAVPGSPILTPEDVAVLRGSVPAQHHIAQATQRMLAFYDATPHWRVPYDHNHLRITRIIRSLRLLSGDQVADAIRQAILDFAGGAPINETSKRVWREA